MDAMTNYYELVKVYTYPYMYVQKSVGVSGIQTPGQVSVYVKCSPVHKKVSHLLIHIYIQQQKTDFGVNNVPNNCVVAHQVSAVIRLPTESDVIIDLPSFNPFYSRPTLSISVPAPILMSRDVTGKSFSSDLDYSSSSDWSSSYYGYGSSGSYWWKSWTGEFILVEIMNW